MLASERIAIAAHLHVLLRRKTGRVTDTEWMATNAEYAAEIVRYARAKAQEDGHPDLAEWANRLERAVSSAPPPARPPLAQAAAQALRPAPSSPSEPAPPAGSEPSAGRDVVSSVFGDSGFLDSTFGERARKSPRVDDMPKYVGGIR